MNHLTRIAAGAAALALAAGPVAAQADAEPLSKCLVAKSSGADRTVLVQFIFSAMSAHPSVKTLGEADRAQRAELAGKFARLFERLLAEDCRAEAVVAIRDGGDKAIETAFGVLGEVAMNDLMAHPNVVREFESMASRVDARRMETLIRESAAPAPAKKPPPP